VVVVQACSTVKVGSIVWVQDPEEAWIDGEVVEVNGEDIKVQCTSGKTVCITEFSYTFPMLKDGICICLMRLFLILLLIFFSGCCQRFKYISKRYGSSSFWSG